MSEQTSQHLRITSPSDTAVRYTVSSRTKEPSGAIIFIRHAFRAIVACYTILATIVKLQETFYDGISQSAERLLALSLMNGFLQSLIRNFQWWILCLTSLVTLYLCVRRDYTG